MYTLKYASGALIVVLQGFKVPTNAYYIHCSDECRDAAKELK
jgi:hypothetical protein